MMTSDTPSARHWRGEASLIATRPSLWRQGADPPMERPDGVVARPRNDDVGHKISPISFKADLRHRRLNCRLTRNDVRAAAG